MFTIHISIFIYSLEIKPNTKKAALFVYQEFLEWISFTQSLLQSQLNS